GDRPYAPLLAARQAEYVACDLDGEVDVRIEPGRPLGLPDASVDGIVSFQVLEHVWDLDWYLGECVRLLKPGGWLLLSTHGTWLYHPHPTDFRRWTRDGLTDELQSRGLAVQEVRAVAGPLAQRLAQRGVDILWVASSGPTTSEPVGVRTLSVPAWNFTERRLGFPYPFWSPLALLGLGRLVRAADVVHLHDSLYLGNV